MPFAVAAAVVSIGSSAYGAYSTYQAGEEAKAAANDAAVAQRQLNKLEEEDIQREISTASSAMAGGMTGEYVEGGVDYNKGSALYMRAEQETEQEIQRLYARRKREQLDTNTNISSKLSKDRARAAQVAGVVTGVTSATSTIYNFGSGE